MKYLLLSVSFFVACAASAQKVSNRLSFQRGQQLKMTVQIKSTMPIGDASVDATIVRLFTVQDANDRQAVIDHRIQRIRLNASSAMGSEDFDSDREADMQSETGVTLRQSLNKTYSMTLNPAGRVLSVKSTGDSSPHLAAICWAIC